MKKKIKDLTFFDLNERCFKAKYILVSGYGSRCLIGLLNSSLPEEWIEILELEVEI